MDFTDKRVTIIGLADSGFNAARLLKKLKAKVRISELRDDNDVKEKLKLLKDVEFEIGSHTRSFVIKSDFIIVSPGVTSNAEPLQWAFSHGINVISELELGYMLCKAPIIAVTGTNGKSTTASLIHYILRANGINSFLLGNIGRPFCEDVLDIPSEGVAVLEVSSFQLEAVKIFRPRIALFLNLSQDHLDRYSSMKEYKNTKLRIFENQIDGDFAVLDYDNLEMRRAADNLRSNIFYFSVKQNPRGSYLDGDRLMLDLGDGKEELCRRHDIAVLGLHNVKNVLAAALAVKLFNKKIAVRDSIGTFSGLQHRFEIIAEKEGVTFINDSKSTTVDSTIKALDSFSRDRVILIAGGKDKGCDYSLFAKTSGTLKHLVLIGETKNKICDAMSNSGTPIQKLSTIEEAVSFSMDIAKKNDVILLSPMCSSHDMFKNYKERGDVFSKAVLRAGASPAKKKGSVPFF